MKTRIIYVLTFILLFLSAPFILPKSYTYAVTINTMMAKVTPSVTPTPTVPKRVEYDLPYPGILPDNPLYFLKNLRDSILEVLITDPIHKAEFYMLQADKKLNMSIVLADMGKTVSAQDTLTQALVSREKAVTLLTQVVQSGQQVPSFIQEKLILSLEKHKEVLKDLGQSSDVISQLLTKAQHVFPPGK